MNVLPFKRTTTHHPLGGTKIETKEKNKLKKKLGVKQSQLVLLAVYKMYGVEFEDGDEALEFVKKMQDWEDKEDE